MISSGLIVTLIRDDSRSQRSLTGCLTLLYRIKAPLSGLSDLSELCWMFPLFCSSQDITKGKHYETLTPQTKRKRRMKNKKFQSNEPKMEKRIVRKSSINSGTPNFSEASQIHSDALSQKRKQLCYSSNRLNILHHVPLSTNIKFMVKKGTATSKSYACPPIKSRKILGCLSIGYNNCHTPVENQLISPFKPESRPPSEYFNEKITYWIYE
ncbi:uncharacterized protein [Pseudorasbora parva]|uniref:uncharacterized protein n=1 Tax=Pseudorasbora parva TaxID=51549 RepID=UPI00351ED5F9